MRGTCDRSPRGELVRRGGGGRTGRRVRRAGCRAYNRCFRRVEAGSGVGRLSGNLLKLRVSRAPGPNLNMHDMQY